MDSRDTIFADCIPLTPERVGLFAQTLAKGFRDYPLFEYVCGDGYDEAKMTLFWEVSLRLLGKEALCYARDAEASSVIVYLPPGYKEVGVVDYLRIGGVRMLFKMGIASTLRLLRFDGRASRLAGRYGSDSGYIMGFATRAEHRGKGFGTHLMQKLICYMNQRGESCYLETLKDENVALYEGFGFDLKEQSQIPYTEIPIYAMHRQHR